MKLSPTQALNLVQIHPTVVITSINEEGVCNAASFSWISPASFNPPMLGVSVSPKRYTHKNLKENGKFVVNILTKHFLKEVMKVGSQSFKENPNKLEESDLSLMDSEKIEVPRVEESVGWLECKVHNMIDAGDHSIVIGKILNAGVEEDFWEERFLPEKAETLHHLGGNEFLVGGNVVEYEG